MPRAAPQGVAGPDMPERVLGRLHPDVGGPHPAALVGDVGLVRTRRHADDRGGDGVGKYGAERDPVQRCCIYLLSRAGALGDVREAQRPVLGHEGAVHDDVIAARAAQPHRVPHVVDGVVAGRQQERAEVDGLALLIQDDAAEQHPAGVVTAGREAPPAVEPVAPFGQRRLSGGRVGGGHPGRGVGAPDVVLGLRREQGELPGMHADHRGDPPGRAARAGDEPDGGEERDRIRLQAAEPGRLEQPEEARLGEGLDRLGRHHPAVLGLLCALPEHREEFGDPG